MFQLLNLTSCNGSFRNFFIKFITITGGALKFYKRAIVFLCLSGLSFQNNFGQVPIIHSFSPLKGPVGTTVTIHGKNFNNLPHNNVVRFVSGTEIVTTATASKLTVSLRASTDFKP